MTNSGYCKCDCHINPAEEHCANCCPVEFPYEARKINWLESLCEFLVVRIIKFIP